MSKFNRNDPCPCGSGKKYKKCCGRSTTPILSPNILNNDLYHFYQMFITFATNKYDKTLKKAIQPFEKDLFNDDIDTKNIYHIGLLIWVLLHDKCVNNKTLFETFMDEHQTKVRQQLLPVLLEWGDASPSIYKVKGIHQEKHLVEVEHLLTHETFHVPVEKTNDYIEGSLVIGILLPFFRRHNFLYSMIKLYRHDEEILISLQKKYESLDGGINRHFPEFLREILVLGIDAGKLDNEAYEEVSQLFTNHLVKKNVSDDIIMRGINVWNQYCEKEKPSFKIVESYAAALEYYVQKKYLNNAKLTQEQIAKEYDASIGTVSSNYRKLSASMED